MKPTYLECAIAKACDAGLYDDGKNPTDDEVLAWYAASGY